MNQSEFIALLAEFRILVIPDPLADEFAAFALASKLTTNWRKWAESGKLRFLFDAWFREPDVSTALRGYDVGGLMVSLANFEIVGITDPLCEQYANHLLDSGFTEDDDSAWEQFANGIQAQHFRKWAGALS